MGLLVRGRTPVLALGLLTSGALSAEERFSLDGKDALKGRRGGVK